MRKRRWHRAVNIAAVLAEEPVEVQRTVIGILTMLKSIARGMTKES